MVKDKKAILLKLKAGGGTIAPNWIFGAEKIVKTEPSVGANFKDENSFKLFKLDQYLLFWIWAQQSSPPFVVINWRVAEIL